MGCTPHNFGNTAERAVHFHLELAMPNAFRFEMPGLGYAINHDEFDKILKRVDR